MAYNAWIHWKIAQRFRKLNHDHVHSIKHLYNQWNLTFLKQNLWNSFEKVEISYISLDIHKNFAFEMVKTLSQHQMKHFHVSTMRNRRSIIFSDHIESIPTDLCCISLIFNGFRFIYFNFYGFQWFAMRFHDCTYVFFSEFARFQWDSLVFIWFCMISTNLLDFQRFSMSSRVFQRFSNTFNSFQMIFSDFQWFSKIF